MFLIVAGVAKPSGDGVSVQPQEQKSSNDKQSQEAPTAQQSPEGTTRKPKRVITNDDLKPARGGGFSGANFSEIDDCDRRCFEQVRELARVSPASNPNWKHDLLHAVDTVR